MYQAGGAARFSIAFRCDEFPVMSAAIATVMSATIWPTRNPTTATSTHIPASARVAGTQRRGGVSASCTQNPGGTGGGAGDASCDSPIEVAHALRHLVAGGGHRATILPGPRDFWPPTQLIATRSHHVRPACAAHGLVAHTTARSVPVREAGRLAWPGEPLTARPPTEPERRQSPEPQRPRPELALDLERPHRRGTRGPHRPVAPPPLLGVLDRLLPVSGQGRQRPSLHRHDRQLERRHHRQALQRDLVHHPGPEPLQPDRCQHAAQGRGQGQFLRAVVQPDRRPLPLHRVHPPLRGDALVPHPPGERSDVRDHVDRAVAGAAVQRGAPLDHVQRRRRLRRGEAGDLRGRRLLEDPGTVQGDRGQDPQGRPAGRPPGHRQDAARPGGRR